VSPLLGELSLAIAVLVAAAGVFASAVAGRWQTARWLTAARWSIVLFAALLTVASAALIVSLLKSDFRVEYVTSYTERALPFGYKLAAFWAGQAGSLLLWAWLLAALSLVAILWLGRLTVVEQAATIGTLALIGAFFAAMLLFAANPFLLIDGAAPPDGRGLNPMLQDPGMIAHPPLLFIGYAGFTIPFAVLVGVLVGNRTDNRWLAVIRRWMLFSWVFLTAGIVLGAWWAYVELGWGGYWAWDPVENASLLPWFTATALLHSMMVQQHRGMFKIWNAALVALTFLLCIFGTYLTRSGVIDSVHAFPKSLIGQFFIIALAVWTIGVTALMIWRRRALRSEHELEGLISREGAFLAGNVLLVIMMLTTLVGTIFPLISSVLAAEPVTVKPPFYNKVVVPMAMILVALMAIGPVLAFGRSAAGRIARSLVVPAVLATVTTVLVAVLWTTQPWALASVAIATLGTIAVIEGFARSLAARRRSTGEGWATAALQLLDRDHRRYGGQLVHLGLMLVVVGVAGSSLFSQEQVLRLRPGQSGQVGPYTITLRSLDEVRYVNFTAAEATVELQVGGGEALLLRPQRRFYDTWQEPNSEVAIRSTWRDDVYLTLAGWQAGITAIQVKVNPMVLWLWIGGVVMVLGGLFCMLPPLLPKPHAATASAAAKHSASPVPAARSAAALETSG
jgi:cytochrome c-type biogenesis protein CcmF